MAISRTTADAYFAPTNHPRASVWSGFSTDERTGAIAHGKRVLARYLTGTLDERTTTDADFPRHDLAVYEQALWSLENSPLIRAGREESADAIASDPEEPDGARVAQTAILAPEARRWLVRGGSVMLGRG